MKRVAIIGCSGPGGLIDLIARMAVLNDSMGSNLFFLEVSEKNRAGIVGILSRYDHLTVFHFTSPGDFKSQMPHLS